MSGLHTVVGAGPLGSSLAAELVSRGERVRLVSRTGAARVPGVEIVAGDVRDPAFARSAAEGSSIVYQCAQPRYSRWIREFAALQNGILDAAASVGARVVIADNLYAYGDPRGRVISSDSPRRPTTRKGRLRLTMAETALADPRIEVTFARPSNYFGPGYAVFGDTVVRRALRGAPMQVIGRTDVAHSFSYVPDAARAMADLAASEKSWGRGWITPVQAPMTQAALAGLVWRAAGNDGEPRLAPVGRAAAAVLGVVIPDLRELLELWYEFDAPFVVDSGEFEREFAFTATPIDEAVAATVEWFRRA
jgi:nucleoside-diphosphate-sugar epimerase